MWNDGKTPNEQKPLHIISGTVFLSVCPPSDKVTICRRSSKVVGLLMVLSSLLRGERLPKVTRLYEIGKVLLIEF